MARVIPVVPEEGTLLCEGCGYILTGLPRDSRCPECAKPIAESAADLRKDPDWERPQPGQGVFSRFWTTSSQLMFHPGRFYRNLPTRTPNSRSKTFARIHWLIASLLVGAGAALQIRWLEGRTSWYRAADLADGLLYTLLLTIAVYLAIGLIARISARLTAWEAAYRGYRLPRHVVVHALDYHAAHYLPVAIVVFLTVAIYQCLLNAGVLDALSGPRYLFLLCAEVVLAAVYLFETYWIGMRKLIYANG